MSASGEPVLADRALIFEAGRPADARATVCITLHDYGSVVVDALESVFEQTERSLGVAVLDDCSNDDGADRVERWLRANAGRFVGVQLAQHRRNQGLAAARNGAIALAGSEYVMVLDADNQLYPRCVERLLQSLDGSGFGFAYPIIEQFEERVGLMGCASWSLELLKRDNYVDAMALIRRSLWQRAGGYSKMKVGGWEDYDFWCKCVEAGAEGLFVPEILARYRMHARSMLRTETDVEANRRRVRREMLDRHPWLDEAPPAGPV